LSKYHYPRKLLRYTVAKSMVKKLISAISQMDINIQQVQAQGLGFDSQIHRWGIPRIIDS
jgi:hypothetical protein